MKHRLFPRIGMLCLTAVLPLSLCSCETPSPSPSSSAESTASTTAASFNSTEKNTLESVAASSVSLPEDSAKAPPAFLSLADFDWSSVEAFRILHTQGPPYQAVTLSKDTDGYQELLRLLRQAKGAYRRTSEGLYGGYTPILLYQAGIQIGRIQLSYAGPPSFSTDAQQSASPHTSIAYPDLYAMDRDLLSELQTFLDNLSYTEEI